MAEEKYVCTLDEFSLKVAKDELGEDPKERESQVETFRKWILQQPHLTAPTDTRILLKFLRTAKFSQLRAREILEGNLKSKTSFPDWMNDIDTADSRIHDFIRTGFMVPIPEKNELKQRMFIINEGAFNADMKKYDPSTAIRAMMALTYYLMLKEEGVIHGMIIFEDFTNFSVKHMSFWGMETMKKMTKLWEGNMPGRYKAFHFFNTGPLFEAIMAVCKPLFSKKMQERFHIHGKNMEDIYKVIPKKYFPEEYLPDDYKGPSQGTMQDIIENLIAEMKTPEVRDKVLYETSGRWMYDKSKRPKDADPSASFRQLSVE